MNCLAFYLFRKLFLITTDYNAQYAIVSFTSVLAHGNVSCRDNVIAGLKLMASKNPAKLLKFMPLIMVIYHFWLIL